MGWLASGIVVVVGAIVVVLGRGGLAGAGVVGATGTRRVDLGGLVVRGLAGDTVVVLVGRRALAVGMRGARGRRRGGAGSAGCWSSALLAVVVGVVGGPGERQAAVATVEDEQAVRRGRAELRGGDGGGQVGRQAEEDGGAVGSARQPTSAASYGATSHGSRTVPGGVVGEPVAPAGRGGGASWQRRKPVRPARSTLGPRQPVPVRSVRRPVNGAARPWG